MYNLQWEYAFKNFLLYIFVDHWVSGQRGEGKQMEGQARSLRPWESVWGFGAGSAGSEHSDSGVKERWKGSKSGSREASEGTMAEIRWAIMVAWTSMLAVGGRKVVGFRMHFGGKNHGTCLWAGCGRRWCIEKKQKRMNETELFQFSAYSWVVRGAIYWLDEDGRR